MKSKKYLLPYPCQLVGWGLLVIAFIWTCLVMIMFELTGSAPEWLTGVWLRKMMMYVFTYIGIILVAFSKEKHEDEMIREIRVSSIAITGALALVFQLIVVSNQGALYNLFYKTPSHDTALLFGVQLNSFFSAFVWFFIYLVIYKLRLWKNRYDVRKELKEEVR